MGLYIRRGFSKCSDEGYNICRAVEIVPISRVPRRIAEDMKQVVTGSALAAPTDAARPRFLFLVVALMVGSSFYVVREPAPCDLLFVVLCLIAPFHRGFPTAFDLNPVLALSLAAFIVGNIASLLSASASRSIQLETGESLLYMAVTFYLVLYWYVITSLIRGYGLAIIKVIRGGFIFAACAATVVGLIVQMGLLPSDFLGLDANRDRIAGSFKDANVYAPFLSAAVIWLASDMINRVKFSLVDGILLCFLLIGIVGALSRGAFVNLIGSFCVLLILRMLISLRVRWLKRIFVMISLVGVLAIPVAGLYLSGERGELFERRLQLQKYDTTRFAVQVETVRQIPQFPLGVGPGQSQQILPQNPHNLYLMVMLENGLLGGLGLIFFLMTCAWICLSGVLRRGAYASLYACCLAILAGTLVNSLVIDSLHWRHFYIFLAIPVGLDRLERAQARLARSQRGRTEISGAAARPQRRRPRRLAPSSDPAGLAH
jgi:O-antigen ligase